MYKKKNFNEIVDGIWKKHPMAFSKYPGIPPKPSVCLCRCVCTVKTFWCVWVFTHFQLSPFTTSGVEISLVVTQLIIPLVLHAKMEIQLYLSHGQNITGVKLNCEMLNYGPIPTMQS